MNFLDMFLFSLQFTLIVTGVVFIFESIRRDKWALLVLGALIVFVNCIAVLVHLSAMGVLK